MFFTERIKLIKKNDKVLEIGPGGTPHPRSDEFLDIDPSMFKDSKEALLQRGSAPELKTDKKITYYNGKKFPYKNNEFDYVIASHVLEHVENVENFINELTRVSKKGYIEYPTIAYDYLYNIPVHLNLIHFDRKTFTIYYMKKEDTNLSDFIEIQSFFLESLDKGYSSLVDNTKETMFEGFEWQSSDNLKVKEVTQLSKVMPIFSEIPAFKQSQNTVYIEREPVKIKDIKEFSKKELLIEIIKRGRGKAAYITRRVNPVKILTHVPSKIIQLNFKIARKEFKSTLTKLENLGSEPFLMPFWSGVNKEVKKAFLPNPPVNFLEIRIIIDTMFVEGSQQWLDSQINYLQNRLKDYIEIVREENIGKPKLLSSPNQYTSHNAIHHLYHQEFFADKTNVKLSKINSVVEWGGGYGSFARIWIKRFKKSNKSLTYTIIDSSLFCSIQWLYLCSIFGRNSVNILNTKNSKIIKGKINLVPLALLKNTEIKGDLFVSTWGLSESAREAQDYVIKHKWFDAKHILIGFQDSYKDLPYAERLGQIAKKDGAKIYDIDFIPNNHYAIK